MQTVTNLSKNSHCGYVSSNNVLAELTDLKKRVFQIYLDNNNKIHAREEIKTQDKFEWKEINRIHGLPNKIHPKKIEELSKMLLTEAIPYKRFGELYVDFRLRGGMLGAIVGGIGAAIGGIGGMFSSNNYRALASQIGRDAKIVVRDAGYEGRATIERAEGAASDTIRRSKRAVKSSLGVAREEAVNILKNAKREVCQVLKKGGKETRVTSRTIAIQTKNILNKAARNAQHVLQTAGIEARETIQLSGNEVRNSSLFLCNELNQTIQNTGGEVDRILQNGGLQVKELIELSSREFSQNRAEVQESLESLLEALILNVENCTNNFIEQSDTVLTSLIELIGQEARGIILNFKQHGSLLIREANESFSITANQVMADLFQGQEAMIEVAGVESRLVIQEFGIQLRSTLYEVPYIGGVAAEEIGQSLIEGMLNQLRSTSLVDLLKRRIRRCNHLPDDRISIYELLGFIQEQNQAELTPADKAALYIALIGLVNNPAVDPPESRRNAFLSIGVAALQDEQLNEEIQVGWLRYVGLGRNEILRHSERVIGSIPPLDIRQQLNARGLETLDPIVEEIPNIEDPAIAMLRDESVIRERRIELLEAEQAIMAQELEEQAQLMVELFQELAQRDVEAEQLRNNFENAIIERDVLRNDSRH